jgi:carbon storage regulator CsrA
MLVLTRRRGESVYIGHDVVVTVLEIRKRGGGGVRLGIDAPGLRVLRHDERQLALDLEHVDAERAL